MNLRTFKTSFLCHTYKFPVSRVKINGTFKIGLGEEKIYDGSQENKVNFTLMSKPKFSV